MKKADIWALGITLYCMTYNKMPFETQGSSFDMMEKICSHRLTFNEEREVSHELKQFLGMMLEKDPLERGSLSELKNCKFLNTTTMSQKLGQTSFVSVDTQCSMNSSDSKTSFNHQNDSCYQYSSIISLCSMTIERTDSVKALESLN